VHNYKSYIISTAVPTPVPESSAMCIYYACHKVVRIEITRQDITQDDSVELRHYEISINDMKINASAQSDSSSGIFYPVEEDNKPNISQIVAVDMCGQRSDPTMISCVDSPTGESLYGHS
jgi:hypothetical protein